MADVSSTVVLELYPLLEDMPSGNDQKEKASEVGDTGLNLQGTSSAEDSDHSQAQIIHVDHDFIVVILQASIRDYLQLIGVNDYKQDHGEVTDIYNDGSAQLRLFDGVSI